MNASRASIAKIIARQTLDGTFGPEQTASLAAYLLEERRSGELEPLLRDVQMIWAEHGVVEVTAITAHACSPEILADIERAVREACPEATRVIITQMLERSLVGGVRLEFAGHRADLSVAGGLQTFKRLVAAGKGL